MEDIAVITKTQLNLNLLSSGKVRDTYVLGENLLMVSTDRVSAFDVVFKEGIPYKGTVLNMLSSFWFSRTNNIIKNHFVSLDIPSDLPGTISKRSMIVKKANPVQLECVVRGYLTGSAFKEYQKSGTICGIELPKGLKNGDELPKPIFTPSTKAKTGHDENIGEQKAIEIVGNSVYDIIKQKSLELYAFGKSHALKSGLVLADTKFEFGLLDSEIILIDEALTPDSSRYWVKEKYDKGVLESLDKQFLRDYLERINWNKSPPPPSLPKEIIQKTSERYLEAYKMLTGKNLS